MRDYLFFCERASSYSTADALREFAFLSDTSFEYTFYDFGNVSLELSEGGDNGDDEEPDYDPAEEKEIPEGYMTTLAKVIIFLDLGEFYDICTLDNPCLCGIIK